MERQYWEEGKYEYCRVTYRDGYGEPTEAAAVISKLRGDGWEVLHRDVKHWPIGGGGPAVTTYVLLCRPKR